MCVCIKVGCFYSFCIVLFDMANVFCPTVNRRIVKFAKDARYYFSLNNGERILGPPLCWTFLPPERGCEVYLGKLPRDVFEDELLPFLSLAGCVYQLRLKMDFSGCNRGYGFAVYSTPEEARNAVSTLNGAFIRERTAITVVISVDNRRLHIGGLPEGYSEEGLGGILAPVVSGIVDIRMRSTRRSAIITFESHRAASMARRLIIPAMLKIDGKSVEVGWAEPEEYIGKNPLIQARMLYIQNIPDITEVMFRSVIENKLGVVPVDYINFKQKFAFIKFHTHEDAAQGKNILNGFNLGGQALMAVWAKPKDNIGRGKAAKTSKQL